MKASFVLLLVSLVGLGTLQACRQSASDDDAAAAAVLVTVQAAHPQVGAIAQHVVADAALSPLAQAALSPRISAPVSRFYVQRGSRVRAGELLATLEHRDLQAAAIDTKGSYTAAQAALATTTGAQVPEETERARLDVAQARATLDLDASIVAARQKLFDQGAIPGRDLDTAKATLVQAQATYDVAAVHQRALESVARKATLQQAQGTADSAKGKYMGAEAQASYAEVRSPIDGVVTDRSLFAGETASAGTPLLTIMDTSALLAKVHLAQSAAQPLHVGDTAAITLPGTAEPLRGTISLISPALDPGSTTLELWIRLENREGKLKVGTPVHVSLASRTVPQALLIPASALLTGSGGSRYVMLADSDGVARKRAIQTGIIDGAQVQVLSGLSATDMVITEGAYGLDDGTKVKVGGAEKDDDSKPQAGKAGSL